jgi:hypothetical protein
MKESTQRSIVNERSAGTITEGIKASARSDGAICAVNHLRLLLRQKEWGQSRPVPILLKPFLGGN